MSQKKHDYILDKFKQLIGSSDIGNRVEFVEISQIFCQAIHEVADEMGVDFMFALRMEYENDDKADCTYYFSDPDSEQVVFDLAFALVRSMDRKLFDELVMNYIAEKREHGNTRT